MFNNIFKKALEKSRETWFGKAMRLFDRATIGEEVWTELEEVLVSADVGVPTTEKLLARVKERVASEHLSQGGDVRNILKQEMAGILKLPPVDSPQPAEPKVTLVVGVNGGGKTTSVAKMAYRLKKSGKSVIMVAADTFRAAAIDQLKRWGETAGVDVIAHQPNADPGAVVYDALQAAKSRRTQEALVDTAGRLHTKFNLMEELKKIRRVAAKTDPAAPHQVILVIDATTGQNGLAQARYFTEAVGVTGIFLAKLDSTSRGGIVLAIADQLRIPVQYVGTGEKLEDMAEFDAESFVEALCS